MAETLSKYFKKCPAKSDNMLMLFGHRYTKFA